MVEEGRIASCMTGSGFTILADAQPKAMYRVRQNKVIWFGTVRLTGVGLMARVDCRMFKEERVPGATPHLPLSLVHEDVFVPNMSPDHMC